MPGKRESKKVERRERILSAGIQAFSENGFAKTRMETVAALSGVAIGTLYNYYNNKGDLLLAILALDFTQERERINKLASDPDLDLEACARLVAEAFFIDSFRLVDRHMLREAIANLMHDPTTQFAEAYLKELSLFQQDINKLFRRVARRSPSPSSVDPKVLAETLFNAVNMETIFYCIGQADDTQLHIDRLNRLIDMLMASQAGSSSIKSASL